MKDEWLKEFILVIESLTHPIVPRRPQKKKKI